MRWRQGGRHIPPSLIIVFFICNFYNSYLIVTENQLSYDEFVAARVNYIENESET